MAVRQYSSIVLDYNFIGAIRNDGTFFASAQEDLFPENEQRKFDNACQLSNGGMHLLAMFEDGTAHSFSFSKMGNPDRDKVDDWTDLVSVAAGHDVSFGLRADGTVLYAGPGKYQRAEVRNWTDIVSLSAGELMVIGIDKSGAIHMLAEPADPLPDVSSVKDPVFAVLQKDLSAVVHPDGTVSVTTGEIAAKRLGRWELPAETVSSWTDVKTVRIGGLGDKPFLVGLRNDGTVVAAAYHAQDVTMILTCNLASVRPTGEQR